MTQSREQVQPPDETPPGAPGAHAPREARLALRDMTRADLRAVRRIESAAYQDAWPTRAFEAELANAFARYRVAIEQPERVDLLPRSRGPLAALRRRFTWDAPREQIVGFMGVWYMHDQMHLVTIAVDPARQGEGAGARLLLDSVDLARQAELPEIVLEVRVGNTRAQALYGRFGFRRAGTLIAYYKDNNEDASVMLSGRLDDPATVLRHAVIRDELRARGRFVDIDDPPAVSDGPARR